MLWRTLTMEPKLGGQGQSIGDRALGLSVEGSVREGTDGSREAGQVAQQPVLVFEVEDPDSVLDGAEVNNPELFISLSRSQTYMHLSDA